MAAGGGGGGRASSSSSSAAASSSSAGALEASLDRKLQAVTNTMESIQGLSSWCLENKRHHSTIVYHWMKWLRRCECGAPAGEVGGHRGHRRPWSRGGPSLDFGQVLVHLPVASSCFTWCLSGRGGCTGQEAVGRRWLGLGGPQWRRAMGCSLQSCVGGFGANIVQR